MIIILAFLRHSLDDDDDDLSESLTPTQAHDADNTTYCRGTTPLQILFSHFTLEKDI